LILRKFFGGKKETKNSGKRNLVSVCQLLPGDLVTFKHRQEIVVAVKKIGYLWVSLDMSGLRSGSLNDQLTLNETPFKRIEAIRES